jgi:hypothetical protein
MTSLAIPSSSVPIVTRSDTRAQPAAFANVSGGRAPRFRLVCEWVCIPTGKLECRWQLLRVVADEGA